MTSMERRPDSQGKVRDIYDAGDNLLMVASDRISAFDYILPNEIPYKGEVLNRISAFWFDKFADIVPNHVVSIDVKDFPAEFADYSDYLAGRAMLVKKAEPIKIECIVRGYLTGSGKKTYDQDGTVCGIKLPAGLTEEWVESYGGGLSKRTRGGMFADPFGGRPAPSGLGAGFGRGRHTGLASPAAVHAVHQGRYRRP